jgi:NDP-sugar pyrophosphorylase family protein/aminoglycoside phosphotransferase (APT) family kinase protein
MNEINVFILAAGLGERLRPVTNHIPKPLVPVLGKPVLQKVLDSISTQHLGKIGINVHFRKDEIARWIKGNPLRDKILLFPEEKILGTGGALKNAEMMLQGGTFLVHNSDIFSDININKLLEHHLSSDNLITLAVHDYEKFNCLATDEKGCLREVRKQGESVKDRNLLAFTGVAVYEPEFLQFLPEGNSGVVGAWLKAVDEGHKIGTFNVSGCYWSDIGSPGAYASTVFDQLRAEGEILFLHDSVTECADTEIMGNVVIEKNTKLTGGVSLRNCIVLPGSKVGAIHESPLQELDNNELCVENCIIGPDFRIDINKKDIWGSSLENGKQLIGTGGSDRKYYRIKGNEETMVLMQCKADDPDYDRQLEYTEFFARKGVPVPELLKIERDSKQAVFKDAGDISLYSYLKCPRNSLEIESIYKKVLDALIKIHTEATKSVSECLLLQERIFDYEHFRWETDYFVERFIKGIRNEVMEKEAAVKDEFHELAVRASSFPRTVIHRDFQSQNIMVMQGGEIRIIDYQGARIGPPAYDAVSLLWDPYHRLDNDMRDHLLEYYIGKIHAFTENFDSNDFRKSLLPCCLQRHMQAIGAYSFLSSVKGKRHFLKYVPEGLRLLKEDVALAKKELPVLHDLISKL